MCSINQSKRSISVRLLFLYCSDVFISRSYENRSNACTLVPTVFRWHGKMEFKCHLHFSFSHDIEKQIWILLFVFRFRITLKNGHEFHFSFFVFASLWKTDNKVAEHSFGSLWVYVICQIMAREPFIRAYKECLSWVPLYLSLEHIFCATYRRS